MAATKRKANWGDDEKEVLVSEYGKRKHIIRASFDSTITFKDKSKAWEEITTCVQQVNPSAGRDVRAVKKKWENLVSQAMSNVTGFKKALQQTGMIKHLLCKIV